MATSSTSTAQSNLCSHQDLHYRNLHTEQRTLVPVISVKLNEYLGTSIWSGWWLNWVSKQLHDKIFDLLLLYKIPFFLCNDFTIHWYKQSPFTFFDDMNRSCSHDKLFWLTFPRLLPTLNPSNLLQIYFIWQRNELYLHTITVNIFLFLLS